MKAPARIEAAEAAQAARRDAIRGAIICVRSKPVAVTFTKRGGPPRTIRVQPAALRGWGKGEQAGGVRSINLDIVSRITSGGTVRTFPLAIISCVAAER